MSYRPVWRWAVGIRRLRPLLALLLLLASGSYGFAAAQGPECARARDAGAASTTVTSADPSAAPLLGEAHDHNDDPSVSLAAPASGTCGAPAKIGRTVDPIPPVGSTLLVAEHPAAPITLRPGALFRPPRTI